MSADGPPLGAHCAPPGGVGVVTSAAGGGNTTSPMAPAVQ